MRTTHRWWLRLRPHRLRQCWVVPHQPWSTRSSSLAIWFWSTIRLYLQASRRSSNCPGEAKTQVLNMERIKMAPAMLQSQRYVKDLNSSAQSQDLQDPDVPEAGTLTTRRSPRIAERRVQFALEE
eukprot:m.143014 g.143014  ORF g.143014 m.143014 type:complete len:125 (+) comp52633_c2_seq1:3577-3951(+)